MKGDLKDSGLEKAPHQEAGGVTGTGGLNVQKVGSQPSLTRCCPGDGCSQQALLSGGMSSPGVWVGAVVTEGRQL